MKAITTAIVLAALLTMPSCLSMARGTTESVRFESNPPGATVSVVKDGITFASCSDTPCELILKRKQPPFTVTFGKKTANRKR